MMNALLSDPNCPVCNGTGMVRLRMVTGTANGTILRDCPACMAGELNVSIKRTDYERQLEQEIAELKYQVRGEPMESVKHSTASSVASQVGHAFMQAGKARLASEANRKLVGMAREALGDRLPPGPMWDAILSLTIPVALLYGTEALAATGHKAVPKQLMEGVNQAAEYALQGVSQEAVNVAVAQALPLLEQVAQLGMGLAQQAIEEGGQPGQLPAGSTGSEP